MMSPRARNGAKRRGSFETVSGTMVRGGWTSGSARMRLRGGGTAISLSASSSVAVATILKSETASASQ